MSANWVRAATIAALLMALPALAEGTEKANAGQAEAVFAGGCFWCMEAAFDEVSGVTQTISGYTGGHVPNPTYQQVGGEQTGHKESIRVRFDPAKVTYAQLLDTYWRNVDPLDGGGQFCDRGDSYKSVIFTVNAEQAEAAEASKKDVAKQLGKPVQTQIVKASEFYPAEDYHQDYHDKNPVRYKYYKWGCGRAQRLEEIWGAPKS